MRFESSITSVSWIPPGAFEGVMQIPIKLGVAHYDNPPPDIMDDLEALRQADGFRFANELRGWIEVEDGKIVDFGQEGGGRIGSTTLHLGRDIVVPAVAFPDVRPEPVRGDNWVRFTQTAGGRTGAPIPRRVPHPPFLQITAPIAWTTLALTMNADGSVRQELIGASSFPRHWIYDHEGHPIAKSGLIDLENWMHNAFGEGTPWGGHDTPALVGTAEHAVERTISRSLMAAGFKPEPFKLDSGQILVNQGDTGSDIFLLLDGILAIEVDEQLVTELGPGAILGERSMMEGGRRTATLRAVTPARVAVLPVDQLDRKLLVELREQHLDRPRTTEADPPSAPD
jgi:hypothetical protein